ncbi:internal scaffolding protein [Sigmofec virus UA08Rod_6125]|uniref:Internal scaffolding protein n=1 Tax=Sigmofec virus UA08Rod_6125 TaxID=2929454 RepID=A0A976N0G7_9VIRU|nr:internal scaffolding protein [Sigmofec virus UA08Rod_6125]
MFYSESNRPKTIPMPETNSIEPVYEEFLDKNGKYYLKQTDSIDLYQKIQDARPGVDLNEVIKKHQIQINDFDLSKIDEIGITDLTDTPDNLIEAQNKIIEARRIYNEMPTAIKTKFNNNFNEFLQGAENGTLKSYINEIYKTNMAEESKQTTTTKVETTAEPTINEPTKQSEGIKYEL